MHEDATDSFGRAVPGTAVTFGKTVGESDVYGFAGITGDLNALHVNEQVMAESRYGRRIAHGVLTVGFMSTASTMMIDKLGGTAVSYGYDRIRFIKPVYIGDTVTIRYELSERLEKERRTVAAVEATNQDGETVSVARHILHFL
jgi:3-hydroxybutyryl-CoA dehydratase